MQEGKPSAFASTSLTPSEFQYAQIEKEMLAIFIDAKGFTNNFTVVRSRSRRTLKPLLHFQKDSK